MMGGGQRHFNALVVNQWDRAMRGSQRGVKGVSGKDGCGGRRVKEHTAEVILKQEEKELPNKTRKRGGCHKVWWGTLIIG